MKYELTRTFPVTRKDGYSFLLDIERWGEWTPFEVRHLDTVQFSKKGHRLNVVYSYFGLPIHGTVTLDKVIADELIKTTIRFPGMAAIHSQIELHGTGTHAVLVTASLELEEPGGWLSKSVQWMGLIPLLVRRELRIAMDKAHALLAAEVLPKETVAA